jgi:antitoxin HigA-1
VTITREDLEAGKIDFSDLIDPDGEQLSPIHPGEIVREEFMVPLGLTAYALAKALRVPRNRVTAIINGERAITAETALRLARYFGTTPRMWLNLQVAYDLEVAEDHHGERVAREVQPRDDPGTRPAMAA